MLCVTDQAYFVKRMDLYEKRKRHMLSVLRDDHDKLSNQAQFIKEFMNGDLVIVSFHFFFWLCCMLIAYTKKAV